MSRVPFESGFFSFSGIYQHLFNRKPYDFTGFPVAMCYRCGGPVVAPGAAHLQAPEILDKACRWLRWCPRRTRRSSSCPVQCYWCGDVRPHVFRLYEGILLLGFSPQPGLKPSRGIFSKSSTNSRAFRHIHQTPDLTTTYLASFRPLSISVP